jgi:hypothetical protein
MKNQQKNKNNLGPGLTSCASLLLESFWGFSAAVSKQCMSHRNPSNDARNPLVRRTRIQSEKPNDRERMMGKNRIDERDTTNLLIQIMNIGPDLRSTELYPGVTFESVVRGMGQQIAKSQGAKLP